MKGKTVIKNTISILLLGLLFTAPVSARDADTVLIVSIDALHPDALSEKTAPALYALMRPGCYTLEGRSVDPPQTLIAHTAMMTGLAPADNGKQDNDWKPGMARVVPATLFDDAKRRGYRTAFYYAKQKLGYLVTGAVDEHALARDDGVDRARAFFKNDGKRFAFLHVSGLENAGTESGWLSPEYLDELGYIDMALEPLLADVQKRGTHVMIVTSDHAGHDRLHGTRHPDDYRVPLIIAADQVRHSPLPSGTYRITGLRNLIWKLLTNDGLPPAGMEASDVPDHGKVECRPGDGSS